MAALWDKTLITLIYKIKFEDIIAMIMGVF